MLTTSQPTISFEKFSAKIRPLLTRVYSTEQIDVLLPRLFELTKASLKAHAREDLGKWDQDKVLLITYGDSIVGEDTSPLQTLHQFLNTHLSDTVTGVHILPFFPYSSDDGFSVIDFLEVNPELGNWADVEAIGRNFNLMFDLVANHVSSQSEWFEQFKHNQLPGRDYFISLPKDTHTAEVVRPRSSPVLTPVETHGGIQHVWTTFSADQVDLNYENPDVFLEFVKIILDYVGHGARYIRLDAVGFLWKSLGTCCIHLPETHAIIQAFREILQMVDPGVALITETNVPNRENLSYFGDRNEAHMIYNFSLPPLLLNALMQGRADHLKTWMMSMPPAPIGCAYFNFTASHDGIGLRPTEGLLEAQEFNTLIDTMRNFGAQISMRSKADGSESPYEINISLFDACKGTAKGIDQWQIERFICSQTVMMSLEGIPAFYLHSLLATPNDVEGMKATGRNRSINRHSWDKVELSQRLADEQSPQAIVLKELSRLIQIRRQQKAFHPNATQYTLHPENPAILAFWRQSVARDQSIFSIHNLSDQPHKLELSALNLVNTDTWMDLISGAPVDDLQAVYELQPYQSMWLTNHPYYDRSNTPDHRDLEFLYEIE
ncbi:alpha-amylase family glycosyl hydrolase [Leptothoe kymatousa]|uniref:Alpha-glucosidase C-terminal domain-containing protein n=1 Tax=Leptothoe kymatousa TAU-MAC 1615 TaxID=2364775 RepID=A0ABS5Y5A3_9CYAN|nr:alpha-amylase family glycosyl hydrolase [Leptothoe kymatousa]MBT9313017.1 alpha-glucosidase C-terminal domain-containing protein [Leptothoe kymatousa TAU-MAC 1615]